MCRVIYNRKSLMDRGVSPFIRSPKRNACRVAGERASIKYNITQHDDRSPINETDAQSV